MPKDEKMPTIDSIVLRVPSPSVNENDQLLRLTVEEARKLRDELNLMFGAAAPVPTYPYHVWPPTWNPPPVTIPAEPYKITWDSPTTTCKAKS